MFSSVDWLFQMVGWVELYVLSNWRKANKVELQNSLVVWLAVWWLFGCVFWLCGLAVWFGCVVWLCGLVVWFGCVVWLCGLVVWFGWWFGCVVGCLVAVADGWLSGGRRGAGGGWSRSQDVRLSQTLPPSTWAHFWSHSTFEKNFSAQRLRTVFRLLKLCWKCETSPPVGQGNSGWMNILGGPFLHSLSHRQFDPTLGNTFIDPSSGAVCGGILWCAVFQISLPHFYWVVKDLFSHTTSPQTLQLCNWEDFWPGEEVLVNNMWPTDFMLVKWSQPLDWQCVALGIPWEVPFGVPLVGQVISLGCQMSVYHSVSL